MQKNGAFLLMNFVVLIKQKKVNQQLQKKEMISHQYDLCYFRNIAVCKQKIAYYARNHITIVNDKINLILLQERE